MKFNKPEDTIRPLAWLCFNVAYVFSVAYKFGVVSMVSGLLGVPAGSLVAQHLRHRYPRIDAHLCGIALLLSTPMVFAACLTASYSLSLCFTFVFFGEFFLNMTWSIVADILLVRDTETWGAATAAAICTISPESRGLNMYCTNIVFSGIFRLS